MNTKDIKQIEEALNKHQLSPEVQLLTSTLFEILYQQSQEILLLKEEIRRLKNLPKNPYPPNKKTRKKQKHPLHPKTIRNKSNPSSESTSQ